MHTPASSPQKYTELGDRVRSSLCRGGFASFTTTCITGVVWHPVVTVMVRQQFAGAVDGATQYRGVVDAFRSIYREGTRAFYRGLGPRLCQSPLAAVQWTTYEMFKDVVSRKNASLIDGIKYAALFCGSRALVTTIKCPFEVIKERMQVAGSLQQLQAKSGQVGQINITQHQSSFQHLRTIIAQDGYRGLFHGLTANIMRDLPVACLMMSGNDFYTHLLTTGTPIGFWTDYFRNDRKNLAAGKQRSRLTSFTAGALSGLTATLLTQPLDVAKTVIQTQSMSRLLPGSPPPKYHGLFHCLKLIRQERGIKFWYTGVTARGLHIMLGGSVYLTIYRELQGWFTKKFPDFLKPQSCPVKKNM